MDARLWELLAGGAAEDEVPAILRLRGPDRVPAGVRVVTRFGEVATVRLPRGRIPEVRAEEGIASLKPPTPLAPEPVEEEAWPEGALPGDERRPPSLPETGRGTVVGIADWGIDFAHPNFRLPDGGTRFRAIWDQRSRPGVRPPDPYGYGVVHSREEIDRALRSGDPYAALGYHPAEAAGGGGGTHGTHVADIAAGNGRSGGPAGLAPEADLVFVHMDTWGTGGRANLGDSVSLLEAVDFILAAAGSDPVAINLSMGRHAGPHDGATPVEQGLDAAVRGAPGRVIVQSTGNYYDRGTHASGLVRPGQRRPLRWRVDPADLTPNELEVWYPARDRFLVRVRAPDEREFGPVAQGEQLPLTAGRRVVGRVYHRAHDPNNLDHQINVFLYPGAAAGEWEVELIGDEVVDGRFHAWVERDAGCPGCQSRFAPEDADATSTTGTICNGFHTIAVGAYSAHSPRGELGTFSSCGPTRDGRAKPDLLAPGVGVLAARSAPLDPRERLPLGMRMSGTSMAAPHVTGAAALMLQAAGRPLEIHETRKLLLAGTRPIPPSGERPERVGSGYLDVERAVAAARALGELAPERRPRVVRRSAAASPSRERELVTPMSAESSISHDAAPLPSSEAEEWPIPGLEEDPEGEPPPAGDDAGDPPAARLSLPPGAVPRIFPPADETVPVAVRLDVRVRNRINGEAVPDCAVSLTGGSVAVRGRTSASGRVRLSLAGVADGDYLLALLPADHTAADVGPAIGSASGGPDRIWRVLDGLVTVTGNRVTGVASPQMSVSGREVTAELQPVWMRSPNRSGSRTATDVTLCVVHHTGGTTARSAVNTFLSRTSGVSAHYVIDTDGQIVKMVHESEDAHHAGRSHWAGRDSVNGFSVGIEIVHATGAYPAAQTTAVTALLQRIRAGFPSIPANRIIGHSDIATCPAPRSCPAVTPRRLGRKSTDPGPTFEWEVLERAGLGIPIGSPPLSFLLGSTLALRFLRSVMYGGFFSLFPGARLRSGDRDATRVYGGTARAGFTTDIVTELQTDLQAIGYFCPVTGVYDDPTRFAVQMFQEHFFSGSRARASHAGQVDERTAETIKLVR